MKNYRKFKIFCIFVFLTAEAVLAFEFVVTPPIIQLKVRQGSMVKDILVVENKASEILRLNVQAAGLTMDHAGNALVSKEKLSPFSCSSWIKFERNKITVEPKGKAQVPYQIKIPYGANGGRYGIILFETELVPQKEQEILLKGQTGTVILLEMFGRAKISAQIKEFKFDQTKDRISFQATITNDGDVHFKAKGFILIRNSLEKVVDRINLSVGTGTILPLHERTFGAYWQNTRKMINGTFSADLQIRIPGLAKVIQEKRIFTIS